MLFQWVGGHVTCVQIWLLAEALVGIWVWYMLLRVLYNVKWKNKNFINSSHGIFMKIIKTTVFFSPNLAMTYLPVLPTFCPSCPRVLCFCNFLIRSHRKPPPPLDLLTSNWPQSVYKANPAMLVELC